jgi:hypothetical protein
MIDRFIAYSNGTVLDTKTNLIWAAKDNGSNVNWANAKSYCENYRGGGKTDWRMPMQDELAGLYDAGKSRPAPCNTSYPIHVATKLIDITCFTPGASETRDSDAAFFFSILGSGPGFSSLATTHSGHSRCVMPDRLFGHGMWLFDCFLSGTGWTKLVPRLFAERALWTNTNTFKSVDGSVRIVNHLKR